MRTIALLANPDSGKGEAGRVASCLRRHGLEVSEHAMDEAEAALAPSPDRIAIAGGDGSLACVAAPAGRAGVPVAVIPTGTANDFARSLELPLDTDEACRLAALSTKLRRLDLAWMDDRPFLNVASLGLAPAAAERAGELKDSLGPAAYGVGAIDAGLRADPVGCVVRCDGEEVFAGEVWQATVACTGAFGAGSAIDAEPADGRLDVVVIEAGPRTRLPLHAIGLRRGDIGEQKGVRKVRCEAAEIELDHAEDFNVDGELVRAGSCRFLVEPGAFEVVVP